MKAEKKNNIWQVSERPALKVDLTQGSGWAEHFI